MSRPGVAGAAVGRRETIHMQVRSRQSPRTWRAGRTAWLLGIVLFLGAAAAAAQSGPVGAGSGAGLQELVVELRVGRLARQTVMALMVGDVVLVPARQLFGLAEMQVSISPDGRLESTRQPWGTSIGVESSPPRAWVGKEEVLPQLLHIRRFGDELYLGTPLLEHLLNLHVIVDLYELTVTLDPADKLPIGRRVTRERMRLTRLGGTSDLPPDRVFESEGVGWRGAAIDWSANVPALDDMSTSTYQVNLGSNLLGGALDLRFRGGNLAESTWPVTGSWLRAWPARTWLRQLRVGAVSGTGSRRRNLYGVAVSSSPYYRPTTFDETAVQGYLEPEWEVELYRDGQLVDFAMADEYGFYRMSTRVQYGLNAIELRGYGPNGEMRILERSIRISADRLPARKLEYEVSGGVCQTGDCDGLANADLSYGLTREWTLRAGVDSYFRDELDHLVHPYTSLNGSWHDRFLLRAESVGNAFHGGEVGYEPDADLRAFANQRVYAAGIERPMIAPSSQRMRSQAGVFWRPRSRLRSQFLNVDVSRVLGDGWTQHRASLRLTTQLRNVRCSLEWRLEEMTTEVSSSAVRTLGLNASTALRSRLLPLVNGIFLRGGADFDVSTGSVDRASLIMGKSIGTFGRFELNSSWSRPAGGVSIALGISAIRPMVHSISRVTRSATGDVTSGTSLEGALLWNGAVGRLEPMPARSSGRGGVSGVVFMDANGNGWRDADEEGIPRVRLTIGQYAVETDELGRYSVWDLGPFDVTELAFDLSSLPNPLWVPQVSRASVTVTPNGFRQVHLPVVRGAELTGRVMRDGFSSSVGVSGIRIVLRQVPTGRRFETLTFHDGEFYFLALPPGIYEVSISPELLERMGLVFEEMPLRIGIEQPDDSQPPLDMDIRLYSVDPWQ